MIPTAALSLLFDILARDRASREFNDVGDAADRAGSRGKALGAAFGGVVLAGAAGLFAVLKDGKAEFEGNQVAAAQLEASLKSTGGVAGVTTDQIVSLADSIEAKTGTDGAAVVSGAALLATFTNVRNEVGKGNDVFARATQAGVDLAAKGFGSVESNAVLLGKALNDPIKGLTALGKQGVTFTGEQKALIESLVATGDTLGAQKIILAEVEKQVGGSAAAYGQTLPGQVARAQAAFDGVKETLFKNLLPAFTATLEALNSGILPALGSLATTVGPALSTAFDGISTAVGAAIKVLTNPIFQAISVSIGVLTVALNLSAIANGLATVALRLYITTMTFGIGVLNAIRTAVLAFNAALRANPIGIVITLLVALAAGLVVAYQRSETFRTIVNNAFAVVKGAAQSVASFFTGTVVPGFNALLAVARTAFAGIVSAVTTQINAVRNVISGVLGIIKGLFTGNFEQAKAGAIQALAGLLGYLRGLGGLIRGAVGNLGGLLVDAGGDLLRGLARGITGAIGGVIDAAVGAARAAVNAVKGALGINSPSRVFAALGLDTARGLAVGLRAGQQLVGVAAGDLVDVAGMRLGSETFVQNRLGIAPDGSTTLPGGRDGEVVGAIREQTAVIESAERRSLLYNRQGAR